MKIINLKAENIKKIKAVDITPVDNTVVITGKNGQGKSSVLDSILYALGGADTLKNTPKPIRDGEDSAIIELDLGDYKVTRTWNSTGTTRLEVVTKDGARYSSPQSLLNDIVGRIAFDPLAFANMKPDEQRSVLLDVLGLTEKVEEIQTEYKKVFDERTVVGRLLKTSEGYLNSLPIVENAPDKLINTAEVSQQLHDAEENNDTFDELTEDKERYKKCIEELKQKIKEYQDNIIVVDKNLKDRKKVDTTELQEKLNNATILNQAYSKALERTKASEAVLGHQKEQKKLTEKLATMQKQKDQLITSVKLPIDGLSIDAEGVTFNKMPFSQLSSAEQLKVSLAIAMSMNPKLRVMRIMDGSLLDSENMKVISQMAKNEDYQIWIERVEDIGNVGFLIENGEVKK